MNLNDNNQQKNDVDSLIAQTDLDLMLLRFEYMALKKSGRKDLDDMKMRIEEAYEDLEGIVKQTTLMNRYHKSRGMNVGANSPELLEKMKQIQSFVGSIVATVPKQ